MVFLQSDLLSTEGVALLFGVLVASTVLYTTGTAVYNLFFHPLRHIPGPWYAAASGIPCAVHLRSGSVVTWLQQLHTQYGDVVRVAPTELSFISGDTAWQDIYGLRTGKYKGTGPYLKDNAWFPAPENGVWSIINSNEADHSRLRRNLSHAFSSKALREQEPLVMGYVDLLIHKLKEQSEQGVIVDMTRWYNYTTFDIIADLSFGEPLNCLRDNRYHEWVDMAFNSVKSWSLIVSRTKYLVFWLYDGLKNLFSDTQAVVRARQNFFERTEACVTARLEKKTTRPDFFTFILQNQEKDNLRLTRGEMDANSVIFLLAGSETTATTLSGTTYLLLKNPAAYKRLAAEIRSAFNSDEDITVDGVNALPYLIAVLQEGLRYYPAVPTGLPRIVPGAVQEISGHQIAGGTSVYMSQHAANHSPRNFTDPDIYTPERWLDDERPEVYEHDKREVVQPFSFGSRICLGKNLAHAEMRLILAKMLWHFDMELVDPKRDWMGEQKVFTLWEKGSLDIRLSPVAR